MYVINKFEKEGDKDYIFEEKKDAALFIKENKLDIYSISIITKEGKRVEINTGAFLCIFDDFIKFN